MRLDFDRLAEASLNFAVQLLTVRVGRCSAVTLLKDRNLIVSAMGAGFRARWEEGSQTNSPIVQQPLELHHEALAMIEAYEPIDCCFFDGSFKVK